MTPYHYGANNPIFFVDVNGDSVKTFFYDKDGNIVNNIPQLVQKMFNEEYGIRVGYNSKTNMLYYVGEVETDLQVSSSAKNMFASALKDTRNARKSQRKYGIFHFGYNLGPNHIAGANQTVDGAASTNGIPYDEAYIDLDDYTNEGLKKVYDYSGLTKMVLVPELPI